MSALQPNDSEHGTDAQVDHETPPLVVDLDMLGEAVTELLVDVADLKMTLENPESGLAIRLSSLEEATSAILGLLEKQPGGPWKWAELSPTAQQALWLELEAWVVWLEGRYLVNLPSSDYELRSCWWRHPVVVEMLTALMVAHLAAYSASAATPSIALSEWHLRSFVPIFATFREMKVFKDCQVQHTDPTRTPAHDGKAFHTWLKETFQPSQTPAPPAGADLARPAAGGAPEESA